MPRIYELCADEAWTHGSTPPNRYWCFFGGVFGLEADLGRLESALLRVRGCEGRSVEVKWSNVSRMTLPLYFALVDEFFRHLRELPIHYRQTFLDRAYVAAPVEGDEPASDLDTQFKICYQFLKHAFGLRYLPLAQDGRDQIFIRLDNHSSQEHTGRLKQFAQELPRYLNRPDLAVDVSFVNSKKHLRMQLCDVLMGAAGSHGNKMHLRRQDGQRGMSEKQKVRHELATYVYGAMRRFDADVRGSSAFNWFATTGSEGNLANRLNHKLRFWKFKPTVYRRDRGWENDRLDKQGRYQGPDILPAVTTEKRVLGDDAD
jgi:hypothetical protein